MSTRSTLPPLSPAERGWFFAIFAVAALLRLWLNDLTTTLTPDEDVYIDLTRRLHAGGFFTGYAELTHTWITSSAWWRYPSPLRFGYLALTSAAAHIYGSVDVRALGGLSTLAGIAVIPLVFAAGRRFGDARMALLATAFTAFAPLQLALGRRALQDEVFCAAVLAAFVAVIALLESETTAPEERRSRGSRGRVAVAVLLLTLALAIKESFLLLYPAFAALVLAWRRPRQLGPRHLALFALPPLLWWGCLAALARDVMAPYRMLRAVSDAMAASYVIQYQAGPPHRILLDFLAVSPMVTLLGCAAVVVILLDHEARPIVRGTAWFLLIAASAFALLSSKNLRFVVMLDPILRLAAAWLVASRLPPSAVARSSAAIVATGAANAAIELEIFRAVFVTGLVYDPVTHALFNALGAVPRNATAPPPAMWWPWICAAIAAALWLWRRIDLQPSKHAARARKRSSSRKAPQPQH